jgi:acyl transferase domain-containing protein
MGEQAGGVSTESDASGQALPDMAWTAGVGRSHFDCRAGIVFDNAAALRERLGLLADSGGDTEAAAATKVAFAYTGQGSQWTGMGRTLYETEPVVRAILDRCEAVMQEERGASLLDVMFGRDGKEGKLGETAWEQPALYALECALTGLWWSVGVRPTVVVGHSIGELAAAQAAGVFSLEDGMRFACARGALMSEMAEGAMAAVFAPPARVAAAVKALSTTASGLELNISADNGTHQVVSGTVTAVNNNVEDEPELANADPYGGAWLIRVRLNDNAELSGLMDAAAYDAHCDARQTS